MYCIEIKLEGLPKTTNALNVHWRVKYSHTKAWKLKVVNAVCTARLAPLKPLSRAKLTLVRHSSVEPDFDNLVSSFKASVDGLIAAQVIENDKQSVIGQPTYLWKFAPKTKGFVTIRVEEVLAEAA